MYHIQRNGLMLVSIFGKVKLLFILMVLVSLIRVICMQKRHVLEKWLRDNMVKGYNCQQKVKKEEAVAEWQISSLESHIAKAECYVNNTRRS